MNKNAMNHADDNNLYKCPHCNSVAEFDTDMPKDHEIACDECSEKCAPHNNVATWQDFWQYCNELKHLS